MLNDRTASELISKSFHGQLDPSEQEQLERHLEQDPGAKSFATISRLIQKSVSEAATSAEAGSDVVAPGLSEDAKERLRASVHEAKRLSVEGERSNDELEIRSTPPVDVPAAGSP